MCQMESWTTNRNSAVNLFRCYKLYFIECGSLFQIGDPLFLTISVLENLDLFYEALALFFHLQKENSHISYMEIWPKSRTLKNFRDKNFKYTQNV